MSKSKTREDVELARIKADLEKTSIVFDSVVRCFQTVAVVACVGILAWTAIRITDKPAWLVLALALLGAGGPPSFIAWRLYLLLKRAGTGDSSTTEPEDIP